MMFCYVAVFPVQPLKKSYLGDKVAEFRIVIARSDELGFDTIDISAWSSKLRRTSSSLKTEEWVEVSGSIKRRFWRGATGLASRWQIDASEITRL